MRINWKKRLEINPSLKNINEWVTIDSSSLPRSQRNGFIRNIKAVSKVANGDLIKDVAKELNISSSAVSKLMNNTFSGDIDELPALTPALIPWARRNTDKRRSKLSSIQKSSGARCSFNYLLHTVSGLNKYLNEIVSLFVKRARHAENLTPKVFHENFLQYLTDHNWPTDQYPFDQSMKGYETCRKYFHQLVAKYKIPKTKHLGARIGFPISRAYDEIQIDSQTLDIHTSASFEYEGFVSQHRLSRMTLFIAIDVATDCILAYKLCFSSSPTQFDLLDVLIDINNKWVPRKLTTPGLVYEAGACLPSSLGREFQNIGVGTISLDNAKCHHSPVIKDYICNEMAASIKYGLPSHPKTRNVVEFTFKRINQFIHRFSCTTGSHPNDLIKESLNNSKKPPILTVNALEDVLSVIITAHNNKPQNRLLGHSPLSSIQSQMNNRLLRINHHITTNKKNPFIREQEVKVCWSPKEKRCPYIHFEGLRYSAPNILDAAIVNKKIIIKFDIRDIRNVEAFTSKGIRLGVLNAPLTWQIYKQSIDSRRYIMKLIKQKLISGKYPLHGVMEYLYKHKELPSEALNLTSLMREFSETKPSKKIINDDMYRPDSFNKEPRKTKFKWTANVVKKRESK